MALYWININAGDGRIRRAFDYSAATKSLTVASGMAPLGYTYDFITDGSEFALTLNGDYPLVFDTDGLLVGDVVEASRNEYPRFEFVSHKCGITCTMATLTQDGMLSTPNVSEADVLPEGMNILDSICITASGVVATKVNEVWFLAQDGNYVCSDGQLIRVRL